MIYYIINYKLMKVNASALWVNVASELNTSQKRHYIKTCIEIKYVTLYVFSIEIASLSSYFVKY